MELIKISNNQLVIVDKKLSLTKNSWVLLDNRIEDLPDYDGLVPVQLKTSIMLNSAIALNCPLITYSLKPLAGVSLLKSLKNWQEVSSVLQVRTGKTINNTPVNNLDMFKNYKFNYTELQHAINYGFDNGFASNSRNKNEAKKLIPSQADFISSLVRLKTEWKITIKNNKIFFL